MNSAYKLVWSSVFQAWVVASELAKGAKKGSKKVVKSSAIVALIAGLGMAQASDAVAAANAVPVGEHVVSGSASFDRSVSNKLVITQSTDKLITNWDRFDIGYKSNVTFVQPNSQSVALNRVTTRSASQIMGTLDANGQVFLVNPNGITFSAGAQVNAASIVASTMDIKDANFLKGDLQFERGQSVQGVVNQGVLTATDGNIVLLSSDVNNKASINSSKGNVFLASADKIKISDNNVSVIQPLSSVGGLIQSSGSIKASQIGQQGGRIYLHGGQQVVLAGALDAENIKIKSEAVQLAAPGLSTTGNVTVDGKFTVNSNLNINGSKQIFSINDLVVSSGKISILDSSNRLRINDEIFTTINSLQQLSSIKGAKGLSGRYFIGTDIDASMTKDWNNGAGFSPIGGVDNPFTGKLYAFGNRINNLTINRPAQDYTGLFAVLDHAVVDGLVLNNLSIKGRRYVGGLAGLVADSIVNVKTAGAVEGKADVGGSIGSVFGISSITAKSVNMNVLGGTSTGGVIGSNNGKLVLSAAFSEGQVKAKNYVGGLVGRNSNSMNLKSSRFDGLIDGGDDVGGVIGLNRGRMDFSAVTVGDYSYGGYPYHDAYFSTKIHGKNNVSAGVGKNTGYFTVQGYSFNSLLEGGTNIGGVTGLNNGLIYLQSYSDSLIKALGNNNIGGMVGFNAGNLSYYMFMLKSDLTGLVNVGGLVGLNSGSWDSINNTTFLNAIGDSNVGGVVGLNSGSMKVYSDLYCEISGVNNVGGVMGLNSGLVRLSVFQFSNIYGAYNTGGITGLNSGSIKALDFEAIGTVSGTNNTGGLIGFNTGTLNYQDQLPGFMSAIVVSGVSHTGDITGMNTGVLNVEADLPSLSKQ